MTPEQREAAERLAIDAMGLIGADLVCEASHHDKKDRHGIGEACPVQKRWHEAFALLRELAAEPVPEPGVEYKRGYEEALNDCIRNGVEWARSMFANNAEHIKLVPEPMAWLKTMYSGTRPMLEVDHRTPPATNSIPVYAAPQQRVPLSDADVFSALLSVDQDAKRLPPGFRMFARAIERAHGITGEQK